MLPSQRILKNVPPSNPSNPQYQPNAFEQAVLDHLDSEYLLMHQGHTDAGMACKECRDLGLVTDGNPLSDNNNKA